MGLSHPQQTDLVQVLSSLVKQHRALLSKKLLLQDQQPKHNFEKLIRNSLAKTKIKSILMGEQKLLIHTLSAT
jgi:hypothetical protein